MTFKLINITFYFSGSRLESPRLLSTIQIPRVPSKFAQSEPLQGGGGCAGNLPFHKSSPGDLMLKFCESVQ